MPATFTTANPIAVGDAIEKQDLDVLRNNNSRLLEELEVQHYFHGAGIRGGRHKSLEYYKYTATAANNDTLTQTVADAAFLTGKWEVRVTFGRFAARWRFHGTQGDFSEWAAFTEGDLSCFALRSGGGSNKYSSGAVAAPYIRLDWTSATNTLYVEIANNAGGSRVYRIVIWRVSK